MVSYKDWHIPLQQSDITLQQALVQLTQIGTAQPESPLMLQIAQNRKFQLAGFALIPETMEQHQHDCIHVLLGRGLLIADEAFTTGFTVASSKKITMTEEKLHAFLSRYLYPELRQLDEHAASIFRDAVKLAYISGCAPLDQFDYDAWLDQPVGKIREVVGLEPDLLRSCFEVEKRRYPGSIASQRLLASLATHHRHEAVIGLTRN